MGKIVGSRLSLTRRRALVTAIQTSTSGHHGNSPFDFQQILAPPSGWAEAESEVECRNFLNAQAERETQVAAELAEPPQAIATEGDVPEEPKEALPTIAFMERDFFEVNRADSDVSHQALAEEAEENGFTVYPTWEDFTERSFVFYRPQSWEPDLPVSLR